jgi:hypothetical protein
MFSSQRTPLLLLSTMYLASVARAAPAKQSHNPHPQPQLEDLQCRCLTFSTSTSPSPCSYQELLSLDWDTAFSLSITNALPIQFASQGTIDALLDIPKPLPLSVLQSVHEGGRVTPLDPAGKVQTENRVVCGFGDEVKSVGRRGRGSVEAEVHYVGTVLGLFMLLLIVYLTGEYLWTR